MNLSMRPSVAPCPDFSPFHPTAPSTVAGPASSMFVSPGSTGSAPLIRAADRQAPTSFSPRKALHHMARSTAERTPMCWAHRRPCCPRPDQNIGDGFRHFPMCGLCCNSNHFSSSFIAFFRSSTFTSCPFFLPVCTHFHGGRTLIAHARNTRLALAPAPLPLLLPVCANDFRLSPILPLRSPDAPASCPGRALLAAVHMATITTPTDLEPPPTTPTSNANHTDHDAASLLRRRRQQWQSQRI
jgi:hypothetical protein